MRFFASLGRVVLSALALFASAAAASERGNLLSNGGAEELSDSRQLPAGWFAASIAAPELRMFIDDRHSRAGKASLAIANQHEYDQTVCNNWAQNIHAVPKGHRVRLAGYVRTDDAEAVNICVQCWADEGKRMVGFATTPIYRGTNGWTLAQAPDMVVPPETTRMIVRAVLTGKGIAYFDDVSLESVGPAATAISSPYDPKTDHLILRRLPVTKDCMVLAYLHGWDRGDVDNLAVSNFNGGVRTLLAWEMPSHEEIDDLRLRYLLAIYCRKSTLRAESARLEIHRLLGPWQERTSWNNQPEFSPEVAATFDLNPGEGWKMLDVTELVREQVRAPQKNFGVALSLPRLALEATQQPWSELDFTSREAENPSLRPMLLIVRATEPAGS